MAEQDPIPPSSTPPLPPEEKAVYFEGFIGGILMGLANLVPGLSGGTMLLAVGVYPRFIGAVAELSTFRFRLPAVLTIGSVGLGALGAIVGLAGVVKDLVVEHRWVMYSIFIGLTLGGVPVILRMIRPFTTSAVIWTIIAVAGMAAFAFAEMFGAGADGAPAEAGRGYLVLFLAGAAGGAAMILPGVSGGYLLLVLGQYVVILDAISDARAGVQAGDLSAAAAALHIIIPVGLGVLVGVVTVSNVIKVMLERFPKATLGFLLGLLLGAVFGLWPFREIMAPEAIMGMTIKGVEVTSQEQLLEIGREDWPTAWFTPTVWHVAGAVVLIGLGFLASLGVSKIGERAEKAQKVRT